MKLTIASVLSLIGAAAAATDGPFSIGAAASGFETGVLNSTILCNVSSTGLNLKNQVIGFGIAANLPNRVNTSQPFYVQAATRLIVPASINNLAYGFGARTYAGNATKVIVNAQGSTPSTIDAASVPLAIPSAPVVSGGVSVLNVPAVGSSIKVGPFTGATANSNIVFSIGDIAATVKTYNSTGGATFLVANITCPAQTRPASLAYVAVGGTGTTTAVTPAAVAAVPTIPVNSTAGVTGYTYSCTFTNVGTAAVRVSLGGVKASNAAVTSGSTISITSGQGNIYSSAALVSLIKAKYSTATNFALTVSSLAFNAVNASPATQNGIPSGGLTSPSQAISSTAVVTIPDGAPTTTLAPVSFTAGTSGSTALISLGAAAGTLSVYNGATLLANVAFSCPALAPQVPIFPYDIL
ncbi:hypothetical protein OC834_006820 [Tilletia horrida]|uniref:Uncharacterized protein n=1 Tax=Tilletia horrida TaxID=155126 RepID=A0AAN6G8M6_9BASI|nr:hypothetical protein OC834_006820 [Tilletia horrida]KAK0527076.1 hypothetical protein OC842_004984 [Tilletia horrida]KAK0541389.1 hypothetical protein OC835_000180 [Tilletia horrida]KAK0545775.1 hypothetical protein OC844_007313 [Tilletia horrida]